MTSLPRSPVSSWSAGTWANLSFLASFANAASSLRVSWIRPQRSCTKPMVFLEATAVFSRGVRPSAAQVIHTVPAMIVPLVARSRSRARRFTSRTTARDMTTNSSSTRTTSPITATRAPVPPSVSLTYDSASSSRPQSRTTLKPRPRN